MKVVNLFAAPGTGKTTTGQLLSGLLSISNYKVEYLPEFAKFATLSNNQSALSDQIYMFAKQQNRLHVLKNAGLDYVIMDGPLPIALLFQPPGYFKLYEPLVMEVFQSYDNVNFLLQRNPDLPYKTLGRNETEAQAKALDRQVRDILERYALPHETFVVNQALPFILFERLTGVTAPLQPSLH